MLWELFGRRRNSLEKLSLNELEEAELRLKLELDRLGKEIAGIENEIQGLFAKAKGAKSRHEELLIASRIKTLSQKKEAKYSLFTKLEKELRVVNNLIIVKEYEDDLKRIGIWQHLEKLSPEELENFFIKLRLDAREREERLNAIVEAVGLVFAEGEEAEEELDDILEVIRKVKEGELEPRDASRLVAEEEEAIEPHTQVEEEEGEGQVQREL